MTHFLAVSEPDGLQINWNIEYEAHAKRKKRRTMHQITIKKETFTESCSWSFIENKPRPSKKDQYSAEIVVSSAIKPVPNQQKVSKWCIQLPSS